MKKITTLFASTLILGLAVTGCNEDLLNQQPLDRLSGDAVWGDIKLAELFVNGTYAGLPNGFLRGGLYMLEGGSDDGEVTYDYNAGSAFNRGDYTPSSFPLDFTWGGFYSSIRRTNLVLEKIDAVPGDKVRRDRLKGEAKFLRAFFYSDLIRQFGGVPLITKTLSATDDLQLPRNTYTECVNFIVKECDEAAAMLPTTYTGTEVGRATKGAALALKARVLLYAASPLFNVGKWTDAAAAAKAVMDMGVYSLHPDYSALFMIDNNKEVIFDRQMDPSLTNSIFSTSGNPVNQTANPIGYDGGWGEMNPTQDLVDAYEMTDGKSYKESPLYNEQTPFTNRDPRFYASIFYNGTMWKGKAAEIFITHDGKYGANTDAASFKTGYYMKKFLDESLRNIGGQTAANNWILIRYAEVLLNYAEAQNETSGPDASVYNAVNLIRSRVKLPNLPTGLTQAQMRERIRNERRVEMAFEEQRLWDIRRWKIAEIVGNGPARGMRAIKQADGTIKYERFTFENRVFNPAKHYLLPIPQGEIDKNKKLQQNPGW